MIVCACVFVCAKCSKAEVGSGIDPVILVHVRSHLEKWRVHSEEYCLKTAILDECYS